MKIVLFVIAVLVLLWLLRGATGRRGNGAGGSARSPTPNAPQPVIACTYCGVHLPRDEALPGRGGVFCGDAHRTAFEKEQARTP
jgi:uncharacterized protein